MGATSDKAALWKARNSRPVIAASYRCLPVFIMGGILLAVNSKRRQGMKQITIGILLVIVLVAQTIGVLTVSAAEPQGGITATRLDYASSIAETGENLTFTIAAADPNNDSLIYSASNLPEGASFDPDPQTFSWTPRYDQAGIYIVHFEVSDGELTDDEDVTITVVQLNEDWDINGDDASNVLDMVLVGQHWGETGLTGWIREDTNEDGTVNVLDMIIIGQHWTG